MEIGEAIRRRREAAGLGSRELAHRAGLDPAAISRYETGRSRPPDETLTKIEEALELRRGQILIDVGLVDVEEPAATDAFSLDERIRRLPARERRRILAQVSAILDVIEADVAR